MSDMCIIELLNNRMTRDKWKPILLCLPIHQCKDRNADTRTDELRVANIKLLRILRPIMVLKQENACQFTTSPTREVIRNPHVHQLPWIPCNCSQTTCCGECDLVE